MPQEFDYFPFYVHQFLTSRAVRMMTAAEVGAYVLLLCEAWISEPQGYLSADPEELRMLSRLSADEWVKAGPKLMKKFRKRKGGLIFNPKQVKILQALRAAKKKSSSAGKAGASARWGKNAVASPSDNKSMRSPRPGNGNKTKSNQIKPKEGGSPPLPPPDPDPQGPLADTSFLLAGILRRPWVSRCSNPSDLAQAIADDIPKERWEEALDEIELALKRKNIPSDEDPTGYAWGVLKKFIKGIKKAKAEEKAAIRGANETRLDGKGFTKAEKIEVEKATAKRLPGMRVIWTDEEALKR